MTRLAALLPLLAFLVSCGAVMRPGPFPVAIESHPPGAAVVYQGEVVGVTPCVVPMQCASTQLELRLAGFHPRTVDVGTTANPWLPGNIVTLGLGLLVDFALGTDRCVDSEPVVVGLGRAQGPRRAAWLRLPPRREQVEWPQDRTGMGGLVGTVLSAVAAHQER